MSALIRFKRGNQANLNTVSLSAGEPAFTLDTEKFFIGNNGLKIEIGNNSVGPVTTLVRANSAYWGDIYVKRSTEQRIVTCYKDGIIGSYSFADSYGSSKWSYLDSNPSSSMTLTLCAIVVNGKKLPMIDNSFRVTVNKANLIYVDPPVGYRTAQNTKYPGNYIPFINNIFNTYKMFTTIWGGFRGGVSTSFRLYAEHYSSDDFDLLFEERYNNIGAPLAGRQSVPAQYFILKSTNYWTLADASNTSFESVIYPEPLTTLVMRAWTPSKL